MIDLQEGSIGIFDSGFGGLTVMRAIRELMPYENIVYFGDTARLPYGSKSAETILRYSLENASFLEKQGIKVLVNACNTSCSVALDEVRKVTQVPVIGITEQGVEEVAHLFPEGIPEMIQESGPEVRQSPGIEIGGGGDSIKLNTIPSPANSIAGAFTHLRGRFLNHFRYKIAILGTRATITSGIFQNRILAQNPSLELFPISCPLFVPLVEEGYVEHPMSTLVVQEYLRPLKGREIHGVLLGCTHYPLLQSAIQNVLGSEVLLINPAGACAERTRSVLAERRLLNPSSCLPHYQFFVSDDPEKFRLLGKTFLNYPIEHVSQIRHH